MKELSKCDKLKLAFIGALVILPGTVFVLPAVILFARSKGINLVPEAYMDLYESKRTDSSERV